MCVAGVAFTVAAQGATVEEFGGGFDPDAAADVAVSDCTIIDDGYGYLSAQAVVDITNSIDATQFYFVTLSVNDDAGARVGEIDVVSNALTAGQSVTLAGFDASGTAHEGAQPGPAACTIATVDRFPSF